MSVQQTLEGVLSSLHVKDPDLGIGTIPVGSDRIEDDPEIALFTWLEGTGGEGLQVDVRITGADDLHGLGFILSDFVGGIAEQDLKVDGGDRFGSVVRDMTIEVGQFAAGQVAGFAHLKMADGEV